MSGKYLGVRVMTGGSSMMGGPEQAHSRLKEKTRAVRSWLALSGVVKPGLSVCLEPLTHSPCRALRIPAFLQDKKHHLLMCVYLRRRPVSQYPRWPLIKVIKPIVQRSPTDLTSSQVPVHELIMQPLPCAHRPLPPVKDPAHPPSGLPHTGTSYACGPLLSVAA